MCFNFLTGRTGPSMGPQSSADKAAGGYRPPGTEPVKPTAAQITTQNQQTADRNTIRRADSYGSQQSVAKQAKAKVVNTNINQSQTKTAAIQGGQTIMTALNNYNKNKKTILGG